MEPSKPPVVLVQQRKSFLLNNYHENFKDFTKDMRKKKIEKKKENIISKLASDLKHRVK